MEKRSLRESAIRALSWRRAPVFVLALGLGLLSSSIGSGLAADDWFHRLVLTGSDALAGVHHRPMDLFVFSNGDPAVGHAQQEEGMIGWWADPKAALAYFRPLSAATHWLDYRLFPDAVWAMHLHSLAWFALGLVALYRTYRRFFEPRWYAVLAFLLFAVDDAHGLVVSWIANRNALIALALGVPVLLLHDRGRRGGERWALFAAPPLFAVALLAGESAAAAGGYVLAHAAFLDKDSTWRRALAVAPYAAVFVAWRIVYAALGYGTHGSGLAVDPVHDPLGFASAVAVRLPVLLVAQFAVPPSDVWELFPALSPWIQPAVYGVALLLLGALLWLLRPALREPSVRFWTAGTMLAALPACSQVPSDRLLLFAGVGAHALVARVIGALLAREDWTTAPRARARGMLLGGTALIVLHLGIAPVWLPARARGAAHVRSLVLHGERTVPATPEVMKKTVVLVNPPADAFAGYLPMYRAAFGIPRPARLRWLVTGATAATIERVDDRTLRVDADSGFLSLASERMQRSAGNPMLVGYTVRLSGMTVTVTAVTVDNRPKEILATFDAPLEDPKFVFLAWNEAAEGFRPFSIPGVGERVRLPALDFRKLKI